MLLSTLLDTRYQDNIERQLKTNFGIALKKELKEMSLRDRPVARLCQTCGQFHSPTDSHLYDYSQPVDDDLTCEICLQPLVDPVDTKCGHTFCTRCITNFLKLQNMCPHDRNSLTVCDLQPASIIIRRLLDKLLVVCPNVDYCEEVLPRCELDAHLIYRCAGAVVKCVRHEQGCCFQGPRSAMDSHLWECEYRDDQDYSFAADITEGEVTRISISRGRYDLGMSIIGGCDSPLGYVFVQEVFTMGLIDNDGRLKPGDQILEVNGVDLTQATHHQAKKALNQMLPTIKMTVYRDKAAKNRPIEKEDIIRMTLVKQPGKQLGIKLVGKKNVPGVYIMDLIQGSIAYLDGRLNIDDRILEVNEIDLSKSSQENAANIIQSAVGKIRFVVSRRTRRSPDIMRCESTTTIAEYGLQAYDEICEPQPLKNTEKTILVTKNKGESLGLSVAGGVGSQRGNTPLYVMNTLTDGPSLRSGVQKGDILLSVNGTNVLGLSHAAAVQILKSKASLKKVELKLLETTETVEGMENFLPSWMYWLRLPSRCWLEKETKLIRSERGNLGFCIVGGSDSQLGRQPLFVKSVMESSAAANAGLRSGDVILAINNQSCEDMTHSHALALLNMKARSSPHYKSESKVTLTVVSWPGTIV